MIGYTDLEEWLHFRARDLEDRIQFADEFEDWLTPAPVTEWTFDGNASWSESQGYLDGTLGESVSTSQALGEPAYAGCADCNDNGKGLTVEATVQARQTAPGVTGAHVWVAGWHADGDNFVKFRILPFGGAGNNGRVIQEQFVGGVLQWRVWTDYPIEEEVDYDLTLARPPDGLPQFSFRLEKTVDDGLVPPFTALVNGVDPPAGTVGVGAFEANVRVGRIAANETRATGVQP